LAVPADGKLRQCGSKRSMGRTEDSTLVCPRWIGSVGFHSPFGAATQATKARCGALVQCQHQLNRSGDIGTEPVGTPFEKIMDWFLVFVSSPPLPSRPLGGALGGALLGLPPCVSSALLVFGWGSPAGASPAGFLGGVPPPPVFSFRVSSVLPSCGLFSGGACLCGLPLCPPPASLGVVGVLKRSVLKRKCFLCPRLLSQLGGHGRRGPQRSIMRCRCSRGSSQTLQKTLARVRAKKSARTHATLPPRCPTQPRRCGRRC
jgi:hypothetical protein